MIKILNVKWMMNIDLMLLRAGLNMSRLEEERNCVKFSMYEEKVWF